MSEKIHVGIISTSWWADEMYLPSLKSHPLAEVAAICGRNRDRAEEMARKYDISRVFTDYHDMIENGNLQAVVVATPPDLHYPMTMDALDAGLHVLCEKPMAFNAEQARKMYEKAQATDVVHMILFTWRWMPEYRYLKELIDEGYLGRSYQCYMNFLTDGGRDREKYSWLSDRRRSSGVLGGSGSHLIDLARWYLGDITKVCAHLTTFGNSPGFNDQPLDPANDSAIIAVQFESGVQGLIQLSNMAHVGDRLFEQRITLHGKLGTLEADFEFAGAKGGIELRGARHDQEHIQPLQVPERILGKVDETNRLDPFVKQSVGPRLFIDAILEDRQVVPNFYEGLKVQEVIDAVIESDQQGCWVSL